MDDQHASLLTVDDLWVSFASRRGMVDAVRGVSFSLGREKVGIVGESGSGKSTVGRSILKLHPRSAEVRAKALTFRDTDLMQATDREMRRIRGRRISMIMQDPKISLDPVVTVGEQIAEAYRIHHRSDARTARERSLEMLRAVKIRDPELVYDQYPHQVSGGMGQRVMIAMMMIPEPDIIIADEPTSALDVTVRLQVLSILDDLVDRKGLGLIFISHDLNLVRSFCDRVLIMYSGLIVESIAAADLNQAQHPYTQGLLAALPTLGARRDMLPALDRDPSWLDISTEGAA